MSAARLCQCRSGGSSPNSMPSRSAGGIPQRSLQAVARSQSAAAASTSIARSRSPEVDARRARARCRLRRRHSCPRPWRARARACSASICRRPVSTSRSCTRWRVEVPSSSIGRSRRRISRASIPRRSMRSPAWSSSSTFPIPRPCCLARRAGQTRRRCHRVDAEPQSAGIRGGHPRRGIHRARSAARHARILEIHPPVGARALGTRGGPRAR